MIKVKHMGTGEAPALTDFLLQYALSSLSNASHWKFPQYHQSQWWKAEMIKNLLRKQLWYREPLLDSTTGTGGCLTASLNTQHPAMLTVYTADGSFVLLWWTIQLGQHLSDIAISLYDQ